MSQEDIQLKDYALPWRMQLSFYQQAPWSADYQLETENEKHKMTVYIEMQLTVTSGILSSAIAVMQSFTMLSWYLMSLSSLTGTTVIFLPGRSI